MARQDNVDINLRVNVTGKEQIAALQQQLDALWPRGGQGRVPFAGVPVTKSEFERSLANMPSGARQQVMAEMVGYLQGQSAPAGVILGPNGQPASAAPADPFANYRAQAAAAGGGVPPRGPGAPPPTAGGGALIPPIIPGGDLSLDNAARQEASRRFGSVRGMGFLLYSAFFSVLFGGLQEAVESIASGKRPPGGSFAATLLPAIASGALGVGGFAIGGPMGAVGGMMAGQILGQIGRSVLEGRTDLATEALRLGRYYEPTRTFPAPELGPGGTVTIDMRRQLQRLSYHIGMTAMPGAAARVGAVMNLLAPELELRGYTSFDVGATMVRRLRAAYGEDFEKAGGQLVSALEDPMSAPYYLPGGERLGKSDPTTAYLMLGRKGISQYLTYQGFSRAERRAFMDQIAPLVQADENLVRTREWMMPWVELGAARVATADPAEMRQGLNDLAGAIRTLSGALNARAVLPGPQGAAALAERYGLQAQFNESLSTYLIRDPDPAFQMRQRELQFEVYRLSRLPQANIGGPFGAMRGALGALREKTVQEIIGRQMDFAWLSKERENPLNEAISGMSQRAFDEQMNKLDAIIVDRMKQLVDIDALLSEGWMEQLIASVHGAPGGYRRALLNQGNLAGAARELKAMGIYAPAMGGIGGQPRGRGGRGAAVSGLVLPPGPRGGGTISIDPKDWGTTVNMTLNFNGVTTERDARELGERLRSGVQQIVRDTGRYEAEHAPVRS